MNHAKLQNSPRAPRRNADQLRRSELAQIHIARQQLGLDDDTYRAVLREVCGVASSAELDFRGRSTLLAHFKARGWKNKSPRRAKHPHKPVAVGQPGLLRVLWSELAEEGRVRTNTDEALGAWLKNRKMPERPEWLSAQQLNTAIEALKKWLDRN